MTLLALGQVARLACFMAEQKDERDGNNGTH